MPRWWLRAIVSLAVAAFLLAVVPIDRVWSAIRGVNPLVWLASIGVFMAGHSLNAMKLRLLLGPDRAPASACLRAHFAGLAANLGLPGVAGGDVVRASYLARAAGGARVTVAAVTDRVLDALVLVAMSVVAITASGPPPALADAVRTSRTWPVVVAMTGAGLAFIAWRALRRTSPEPLARQAASGLVARPNAVLLAMTTSCCVQSIFVLTLVWLASEVGVRTPLAPWFLAWTSAKASAVLPISLGGIGVREATLVSVLAAYDVPADGVLAAGILWEGALVVGSITGFLATHFWQR